MSHSPLRIVFMGSPDFSVSVLKSVIAAGHEVVCVYSQPPRRAGRGKNLRPTPVHAYAEAEGLEVRTPLSLKTSEAQAAFAALKADLAVVVAYGLMLPQEILDATRLGCLNMHASILPRWRGAAPIQRAIMAGDKETGVDAMMMEAGLDTGPVLASARTPIQRDDTAGSLHDRLAELGADLAPRAIAGLADGALQAALQPNEGATYAHKITAKDFGIDWSKAATVLNDQIRGLMPDYSAFCYWPTGDGPIRLKVLEAEVATDDGSHAYGVIARDGDLVVQCGQGALRLLTVQKPGGKPVSGADFMRGASMNAGQVFESVPVVRRARAADAAAIQALNDAAFEQMDEGLIAQRLDADGDTLFSLVTEFEGEVVGHLQAFYIDADGARVAAGIGPMSVQPKFQKRGYGGEMIKEAMGILRRKRIPLVFVLGHADYYPRFGFSAEAAQGFDAPWPVGPSFMAMRLGEGAPDRGVLRYPAAFAGE